MRDAERAVWDVLQHLDASWHVFYSARENSSSGWDREVDFVLIRLNRIFYCEVKGGVVIVDQRAGPGVAWKRYMRSGEAIQKRADSTQLWSAKAALEETICQISGQSPRSLGFRQHDVYIFPHTPRRVTQGADLERSNTHYVFEEDIAELPLRLQQIAASGKGRFINRERIESIIQSLDAMVIKEGTGALPPPSQPRPPQLSSTQPQPEILPAHEVWRPVTALIVQRRVQSSMRGDRIFRQFKWRIFRLPRIWKVGVGFVALFAVLSAFVEFNIPLVIRRDEPPGRSSEKVPAVNLPKSTSKPPVKDMNAALPGFIAPASVAEVERAIAAAQDPAVYISWQSGAEHGLVILRSRDDNGCRQYQVSRHDMPPTKYATIRRCP